MPVRVRFENLRPLYDYWGNEIRRHFQLETLAASTDALIRQQDPFILPSVRRVMGAAPITHLRFSLVQESYHQLVFKLTATNANKTEGAFAFIVAKKEGETSAITEISHKNLRIAHGRAPEDVVQPFEGGRIMLLASRRARQRPRFIYAYVTQWSEGFRELGVDRSLRFFVNVVPHQLFSDKQTEQLKGRLVALLTKLYDPVKRECMEVPQIASGDVLVGRVGKPGPVPRIMLFSCRRLVRNVAPARFLHNLAAAEWEWGSGVVRLLPSDPEITWAALTQVIGVDAARQWAESYRRAVVSGRYPERSTLPLSFLERVSPR